jgi:hypothetical protein
MGILAVPKISERFSNAFRSLLGIGTNGEGPTYAGIYEGTWKHPTMDSHHD